MRITIHLPHSIEVIFLFGLCIVQVMLYKESLSMYKKQYSIGDGNILNVKWTIAIDGQ